MEDIFVWFYRAADRPKGVPFHLDTMLAEQFSARNPMPGFDYPWVRYNPYQMDFPPTDPGLQLPDKLVLVVKKNKEVLLDYMYFKNEYKIVSQEFLDYLIQSGVKGNYEASELSVVDTKGKNIAQKKYYALRFGRFDDELLNFDESTKVAVPSLRNRYLYPSITTKDASRKIYFVDNFCYREAVLMTAEGKREIEQKFYEPQIYSAADFVNVYQEDNLW